MKKEVVFRKIIFFIAGILLIYVLLFISNTITGYRDFFENIDGFVEGYLPLALFFAVITALELWVAAGIFGSGIIAGDIISSMITEAQGPYPTMSGSMTYAAILFAALLVACILQGYISLRQRNKRQ